ncbi:WhiB family transcriptional regulator [[Mycobacterium] kokjensenii]|uniref:WhiB family transcriptional regulator n=1 Tax=[Mycobacterium] kokjensenii TaxID=3064287 RepID=A0ABM9LT56_9MYCO|nr:WhiB family transcriptional regulator [Mycolicibacter sp. MU0083]CAJ1504277.1 WhiB family transcriptional regulator [Mycolicibacter sp. MU0083]
MVAVLGEILAGTPRLRGAACRDHPAVFFASEAGLSDGIDAAARICARCPVAEACHDWYTALPSDKRPLGVTAGVLHPKSVGRTNRATRSEGAA